MVSHNYRIRLDPQCFGVQWDSKWMQSEHVYDWVSRSLWAQRGFDFSLIKNFVWMWKKGSDSLRNTNGAGPTLWPYQSWPYLRSMQWAVHRARDCAQLACEPPTPSETWYSLISNWFLCGLRGPVLPGAHCSTVCKLPGWRDEQRATVMWFVGWRGHARAQQAPEDDWSGDWSRGG